MIGFVGLFVIFLMVLVVVGLITGIVLWSTSGSGSSSTDMSCGSCGYAVRGLSELTCPECGADLREVGINRGASAGRRTAGVLLTCVCGGLMLVGCGLTGFGMFVGVQSASPSPMPAASQSLTAPSFSGGPIVQHPDGSTTITNPDGSTVTTHPDGSTTLTWLDGKTSRFDADGVEIPVEPEEPEAPDAN